MIKVVQTGVTRIVFLIGKYAVKMPRVKYGWRMFITGLYSNMSEAECWNITKSRYLCPVLFQFAGFMLIMPRVNVLTSDEEIPQIHLEGDGCDHSKNNYGWHNGQIVCIDYPYYRIKPYKR